MSQEPRPRVPTSFTSETTADEVLEDVDLAGRRTLITGATSGPGLEAAVALVRAGADVTIAVRELGRGYEMARWIRHRSHGTTVKVTSVDLGDLRSVRALVTQWDGPLDILINAAHTGVTATRQRTPDGLEHQFGINYFGHFALTREFRHRLQQSGNGRTMRKPRSWPAPRPQVPAWHPTPSTGSTREFSGSVQQKSFTASPERARPGVDAQNTTTTARTST